MKTTAITSSIALILFLLLSLILPQASSKPGVASAQPPAERSVSEETIKHVGMGENQPL